MAESRIEELRRRVGRDPGSRLFAQLAEEERKAGDLNEAVRIARAGLEAHPSYPAALLTLGRALLDSGDAEAARTALEEALRQAPDNILVSRFLGQALEAVGDLGGALGQYQATLRMAPGDRQLEERLRSLEARLASPKPTQPSGSPGAPQAGSLAPAAAMPAAPGGAGKAAGPEGAPGQTEGAAEPTADVLPFSSGTLAELYLRQGFAERAVEVYRQVVAERPDDVRARRRLHELASSLGVAGAGTHGDTSEGRRRALQRTIAGLEVLLGVARRR